MVTTRQSIDYTDSAANIVKKSQQNESMNSVELFRDEAQEVVVKCELVESTLKELIIY